MTTRFLEIAAAMVALGVLPGCADGAAGGPVPAGTTSGSVPPSAPASAGSPAAPSGRSGAAPGGIGASAARTSGVFSGPYDAALRGPSRATAGRITLRLVNVGTQADSYRITVRPAAAATLTPATATLAPGAGVALDLRLTADASVHVVSAGRRTEVADLPIELG